MAEIDSLVISVQTEASAAAQGVDRLTKSLDQLEKASGKLSGGLAGVFRSLVGMSVYVNQVGQFTEAIQKLRDAMPGKDSANGITKLQSALKRMSTNDKVLSSMKDIGTGIDDLYERKDKINELADAMQRLKDALPEKNAGKGLASAAKGLDTKGSGAAGEGSAVRRATRGAADLYATYRMVDGAIRMVTGNLGQYINQSNKYIEDLNLFSVAMGVYADSAEVFANKVADVMGIDPADWLRTQGVFMTLASGFGVAGDKASVMSQQLTQLGYDISSFYNISVEDAMQKLQSGISGELEPLRRLGYDLSDARLKAEAAALGIQKTTSSMTQAEKVMLRYRAIMTQVTSAQGDMSRTLDTPANQLRIFSAQIAQVKRAIGDLLIPAMNAILPYAIAVAKAIRLILQSIASLFGVKLPEIDYSGISVAMADAEDASAGTAGNLGKAAGSAKKLKSYMMGFDELNVIDPSSSSGGGSGGGGGGGSGATDSGWDWDLPTYDFLGGASEAVAAAEARIKPFIDYLTDHGSTFLALAEGVGAALLLWKLNKDFLPDLTLGEGLMKSLAGFATSIVSAVVTVALSYHFTNAAAEGAQAGDTEKYLTNLILSGVTAAGGSLLAGLTWAKTASGMGMNGASGGLVAGLTLAISAGLDLSVMINTIKLSEGVTDYTIGQGILAAVKGAFAGAAIAIGTSGLSLAAAGVGAGLGFVLTGALAIAFSVAAQSIPKDSVNWGSLELSAEEMKQYAASLFSFDIEGDIKLISSKVSGVERAEEAMKEAATQFNTAKVSFEVEPTLAVNAERLNVAVSGLVSSMNDYLTKSNDLIVIGTTIAPPVDKDGNPLNGESIVSALGLADTAITTSLTSIGQTYSDLITKGMTSTLSEQEETMVNAYTTMFANISAKIAELEAGTNLTKDVSTSLSGLTRESFAGTMNEVAGYLSDYETELRNGLIDSKAGLENRRIILQEIANAEEANGGVTEATRAALGEIDSAIANFGDIDARVAESVKTRFASTREAVQTAIQGLFVLDEDTITKASNYLNDGWAAVLSAAKPNINKREGQDKIDALSKQLEGTVEAALRSMWGQENAELILSLPPGLGITGWDVLGTEIQTQIYNLFVEKFGSEETQEMFRQLGYPIPGYIAEGAGENTPTVKKSAQEVINNVTTNVNKKLSGAKDKLKTFGEKLGISFGGGVESESVKGAKEAIDSSTQAAIEEANLELPWWKRMGISTGNATKQGFESTPTPKLTAMIGVLRDGWTTVSDYVSKFPGVKTTFHEIGLAREKAFTTVSAFVERFKGAETKQPVDVTKGLTLDAYGTIWNWFYSALTSTKSVTQSVDVKKAGTLSTYGSLYDWFRLGLVSKTAVVQTVKATLTGTWDDLWDTFTGKKTPTVKVNAEIKKLADLEVKIAAISGDKAKITMYASGGFPEQGQLFMAREAGAEMVGNIGSRTAVVNNDQIVESVSGGVRAANSDVVAAINTLINAVNEKDLNVSVGDDAIGRSYDRYKSGRGASVSSPTFANAY